MNPVKKICYSLALILSLCFVGVIFADGNAVPTPYAGTVDAGQNNQYQNDQMMEKCQVVDSDGNGLIRPYMADSGTNLEGDASAWIWVPYGQCAQINAGNFNGISPAILSKINPSNIQQAPTLE